MPLLDPTKIPPVATAPQLNADGLTMEQANDPAYWKNLNPVYGGDNKYIGPSNLDFPNMSQFGGSTSENLSSGGPTDTLESSGGFDFGKLLEQYGLKPPSAGSSDLNAFSDTYKQLHDQLGLTDIKAQFTDLTKQLEDNQNALADEVARVNENPYLPEGNRQKRIQALQEKYATKSNNLTNRINLLDNLYARGEQQAQFLTQGTLQQQQRGQDLNKDLVFKAIELAQQQAQNEAQIKKEFGDKLGQLKIEVAKAGGNPDIIDPRLSYSKNIARASQFLATGSELKTKTVDLLNPDDGAVHTYLINEQTGETLRDLGTKGEKPDFGKTQVELNYASKFEDKQEVKDFKTIVNQYGRMREAYQESLTTKNFVAVDQALIGLYNKMIDPSSVIRESEYARTPQDQGILRSLQGKAQKVLEGGAGLDPSTREALFRMGSRFAAIAQQNYTNQRDFTFSQAQALGLNPDLVVGPDLTQGFTTELPNSPDRKKANFDRFYTPDGGKTINRSTSSAINVGKLASAIGQFESGNNYKAIGKKNRDGSVALGRYQILNTNLPSWSREVLGHEVSTAEFLHNPSIQDAIAMYKIGQLVKKYGNSADVASSWFSGRPLANNTSKDVIGTSVPQYVKSVISLYNRAV